MGRYKIDYADQGWESSGSIIIIGSYHATVLVELLKQQGYSVNLFAIP